MSLLADLLSKNKTGSSHDGTKKPPVLDIPPTLFKAHGIPARVRKLNNRYVIVAAVSVAFIALGALVTAKFELLSSSVQKKTAIQPHVVPAPPALTPPVEQAKTARITLGEPPAPVPHKVASSPPVVISSRHPAQKIRRTVQQAPAQPRQSVVPPRKIDTAMRDALLYTARSAELAGDWRAALASYRKALKIDPDNYKILSNLAATLNNLGMFDDGAQEAERALAKKPNYVPALINAAIGYSSSGNTQKALRLFTYASALDPNNRNLTINLGILHERAGNLDAAQATYRQLAINGDPLALQGMGRIYERRGNRSEAIRAYRQIMALPNATAELKKEAKDRVSRLEE